MLRTHNSNTENIAPPSHHSQKHPQKTASRKPLGARQPLSALAPNKPSQTSVTRPKRRALGDITNRSSNEMSAPLPTKHTVKEVRKLPAPPVDRFGNIEDPHLIPDTVPAAYDPPVLFDDDELAELTSKVDRERKGLFGSPDLGRLLRDSPPRKIRLVEDEEEREEDSGFDMFEKTIRFGPEDFLSEEDLVLGENSEEDTA